MSQQPPTQPPAQGRSLHRVIIGESPSPPMPQPTTPEPQAKNASPRGLFSLLRLVTLGLIVLGLIVGIAVVGGKGSASSDASKAAGGSPTTETTPRGESPTIQPGSTPALTTTIAAQDLPGTPMPNEGNEHVSPGLPITYKNYPPTSGTHYPGTAEFGFSYKEIAEGFLVHSLEHGAIVLYYRPDLPDSVKASLRGLLNLMPPDKDGNVRLIVVPYPKLRTPMAVAAWTRLLPLSQFDFIQIWLFYRAWMGKGPEG